MGYLEQIVTNTTGGTSIFSSGTGSAPLSTAGVYVTSTGFSVTANIFTGSSSVSITNPVFIVNASSVRPKSYEATSFTSTGSPFTASVNSDLGVNAHHGNITNDGAGNFTVAISNDASTSYGSEITLFSGDVMPLEGLDINKIRLTWVADSSYRIWVA